MAVAFVPDWDPTIKQKPREPAPWGNPGGPEVAIATSSYSQHYQKWPSSRMPNFKPKVQYNPDDRTPFNTKSTAQDAFQPPIGHKQIPSFKPAPKYQSVDWQQPITTTAQSTFIRYGNVPKTVACRPKQQEQATHKFTGRSTQQDSFQSIPTGYKPVQPFYPSSDSQVAPAAHHPSNFQTTFQVRAAMACHTPQQQAAEGGGIRRGLSREGTMGERGGGSGAAPHERGGRRTVPILHAASPRPPSVELCRDVRPPLASCSSSSCLTLAACLPRVPRVPCASERARRTPSAGLVHGS